MRFIIENLKKKNKKQNQKYPISVSANCQIKVKKDGDTVQGGWSEIGLKVWFEFEDMFVFCTGISKVNFNRSQPFNA